MARIVYTEEHIEYIRKISDGKWNEEIRDLFNVKFNMKVTTSAISSVKAKNKIVSNVIGIQKEYTKEQMEYIKQIAPTRSNKEVMGMFNKKFNQDRTDRAIRAMKNKLGITTTYKKVWEKGNIPWNKGKKGYMGANVTSFKKGEIPPNYQPIGTERTNGEGYIDVKVADPGVWKQKHHIVWEKVNGDIPKGFVVIFGDGDKTNLSIDNLMCISRKQLLGLNRYDLIQNDAELTRTAVNIVDLTYKISEVNREG